MRLLIFGLGDYYSKYKRWIRDDLIVGLLDNDTGKQGKIIDGHTVYSPEKISSLKYDLIVILSVHEPQMRQQLLKMGVRESDIIGSSELPDRKDILNPKAPVKVYAPESDNSSLVQKGTDNTLLLMSPNLDNNGATMVLFYAAQTLCKAGFRVVFASWHDGVIRDELVKINIPVIVDPNLEIDTADGISWINGFLYIICNTIHYYRFLSNRAGRSKIIWWLHEPPCFYDSLDIKRLRSIDFDDIVVCAAGPLAAKAFEKYNPQIDVKLLLYGLPDVDEKYLAQTKDLGTDDKLTALVLANVQQYKGQDVLVDAVLSLTDSERDRICFRIIGNNNSAYAKEQMARSASFGNCIEFCSLMDRDSVMKELRSADLLICPSREDVMPISVCEGMQYSRVCIVSDAAGNSAYITDEYDGLVFSSDDPEGLSRKIRWCIDHKDSLKDIGARSRKIYDDHFSMEVFGQNIKKLINDFYGLKS
ncbi:MAG: glycosyltransferase family 4 protein [Lachnospiraceae bacterium]|nr:glycosyltransferase family 4 protein [Lachnospiraceae bacterium]